VSEGNRAEELAGKAAEAVRRTVAEAEAKAEQIVRDAEAEAKRIRDEVQADAKRIRDQAEAEARERIDSASKALEELRGKLAAVGSAPSPAAESQPAVSEPEPVRAEPEVPTAPPTETQPATGSGNGDDAAARLVAMKLAVDGRGRDEIEAELTQRFGAGDRSGLLDDVLARARR
jgi:vacuolar-type H+-ATPase subunit H